MDQCCIPFARLSVGVGMMMMEEALLVDILMEMTEVQCSVSFDHSFLHFAFSLITSIL